MKPQNFFHSRTTKCLTSASLDLRRSTLGTLLGHLDTTTASGGRVLGLLGLLLALSLGLLLLAGLDGLLAGGGAGSRGGGALGLDHIEGSTDDSTLGLDGAACALLGDLL